MERRDLKTTGIGCVIPFLTILATIMIGLLVYMYAANLPMN